MDQPPQPPQPPPQTLPINAELVRSLRNLLTLAERGQLVAAVVAAADAQGGTVQVVTVPDPTLPALNAALDSAKAKLISRMLVLEKQGQVSPIIRAPGGLPS